MQIGNELIARHAEGFRGRVQIQPVAGFVLHLGHQDRLALERRGARDPVAFRQHAHDLGMRVLRNLPDERLAVGLGHPVLGLDAHVGVDALLERALLGREFLERAQPLRAGVDHLRIHWRGLLCAVPGGNPGGLAGTGKKRYTFSMIEANFVSRCGGPAPPAG